MNVHFHKSVIAKHLEIDLPLSKSISNRNLILAALAGKPLDFPVSSSEDSQMLRQYLQESRSTYDFGIAGAPYRFFLAWAALNGRNCTLTGSPRMQQRPIGPLVDCLRNMGANIEYAGKDGFPPVALKGGALINNQVSLKDDKSSQHASALALIAPFVSGGLNMHWEGDRVSESYFEMTIEVLRAWGVQLEWSGNELMIEEGTGDSGEKHEIDWSSATFWYQWVACGILDSVLLKGLTLKSLQGDRRVSELFEAFGVVSVEKETGILIKRKGQTVKSLNWNFLNMPDAVTSAMTTALQLDVEFSMEGVHHLAYKESDRIAGMAEELGKVGGEVRVEGERVIVSTQNSTENRNLAFHSHGDHRLAMALSPLAAELGARVELAEVVNKSYPEYWTQLKEGVSLDVEFD